MCAVIRNLIASVEGLGLEELELFLDALAGMQMVQDAGWRLREKRESRAGMVVPDIMRMSCRHGRAGHHAHVVLAWSCRTSWSIHMKMPASQADAALPDAAGCFTIIGIVRFAAVALL
jgi:hypothetical protein